jgi:hypothetical protein
MLAGNGASAECCRLVKVEAEPATTRVRVCDPNAASGCTTALFEGEVAAGAPREVCSSADSINYQEWDVAAGSYGPMTEARCEPNGDVEI